MLWYFPGACSKHISRCLAILREPSMGLLDQGLRVMGGRRVTINAGVFSGTRGYWSDSGTPLLRWHLYQRKSTHGGVAWLKWSFFAPQVIASHSIVAYQCFSDFNQVGSAIAYTRLCWLSEMLPVSLQPMRWTTSVFSLVQEFLVLLVDQRRYLGAQRNIEFCNRQFQGGPPLWLLTTPSLSRSSENQFYDWNPPLPTYFLSIWMTNVVWLLIQKLGSLQGTCVSTCMCLCVLELVGEGEHL